MKGENYRSEKIKNPIKNLIIFIYEFFYFLPNKLMSYFVEFYSLKIKNLIIYRFINFIYSAKIKLFIIFKKKLSKNKKIIFKKNY